MFCAWVFEMVVLHVGVLVGLQVCNWTALTKTKQGYKYEIREETSKQMLSSIR